MEKTASAAASAKNPGSGNAGKKEICHFYHVTTSPFRSLIIPYLRNAKKKNAAVLLFNMQQLVSRIRYL